MSITHAMVQMLNEWIQTIESATGAKVRMPYFSDDFESEYQATLANYIKEKMGMSLEVFRGTNKAPLLDGAKPLFIEALAEVDRWLTITLNRMEQEKDAPSPFVSKYLKLHFAAVALADQKKVMNDVIQYLKPVGADTFGVHDFTVEYHWNGLWCVGSRGAYTGKIEHGVTMFCPYLFSNFIFSEYPILESLGKTLIHEALHRQSWVRFSAVGSELYESDDTGSDAAKEYKAATMAAHLDSADSFAAFARDIATIKE